MSWVVQILNKTDFPSDEIHKNNKKSEIQMEVIIIIMVLLGRSVTAVP